MKEKIKLIWDHRHLLIGWLWIALAVPTLIWWHDSILWVAFMSLYANTEASFAAHHAKQANQ